MKNHSIAIFGCLPPPVGGMSMHVKRISALFESRGIPYKIYSDLVGKGFLSRLICTIRNLYVFSFSRKHTINYVISSSSFKRFIYVLMGEILRKKVIIRIGGFGFERNIEKGGIFKFTEIYAVKHAYKILVVSKEIYDNLILVKENLRIKIIPGFIRPYYEISNIHTKEICDFFGETRFKVLTTGQLLSNIYHEDIYGIIPLIKWVKNLKEKRIDLKLIIILYGSIDKTMLEYLRREIETYQVKHNVLIIIQTDGSEIIPLLRESNIFIRNSFEDGDSNVLREAIFCNNKVYATDCVSRPKDTYVYKTGEIYELEKIFMETCETGNLNSNFLKELEENEQKTIKFLTR